VFAVTYLGQQGWLIASGSTRILIDPLLTDEYSPGFSAVIHPPRRISLGKLPAIDAVVLSHEHADHFNVPSLLALDRRIPVFFPERSAVVVRDVIERVGFRVMGTRPGDRFSVGDLEICCFAGEHADSDLEGEWACLQLLVMGRDGSFFSYVDGTPSDTTVADATRVAGRIGVFVHANNMMDWSVIEAGRIVEIGPRPSDASYAAHLLDAEATWWRDAVPPAVTLVCGPGLAFVEDDAWMNQILTVDSERVCATLAAATPARAFHAPCPGETFELVRGELAKRRLRTPFMATLPRARWPSLTRARPLTLLEDYAPACGRTMLEDDGWAQLFAQLDHLASFLYGRSLFRALHTLDGNNLDGRRAAFAIVLRADADGSAYVCEYRPSASAFEVVDCEQPADVYVFGLECWGTDLAAVLAGELMPQRLLGHARSWSFAPVPLSPLFAIWRFFDFVHRPAAGAAFYEALVARTRAPRTMIAAGRAAISKYGKGDCKGSATSRR
jgi:beta-lactamase family protein